MEAMNYEERKTDFERKIDERIPTLLALQSLIIGKELNESEVESIREFKCVQDYLDLPLNDAAEKGLKKIVVAAVVTASQLGILQLPEGCNDAESIASIVDEGLTRVKIAYQVANGILNPIDATEAINDRATVRVAAVVDMVTKKLEEKAQHLIDIAEASALSKADAVVNAVKRASYVVGTYVVKVFPPAKAIMPVIVELQKFVEPAVKQAVKKGIKVVADTARKVVTKAAEKVKSFAKRVLTKLLG